MRPLHPISIHSLLPTGFGYFYGSFIISLICRRGPIRLNRISSDPQPNTTSPTTFGKPPQDGSQINATNPGSSAGYSRHQPLPNSANQHFGANISFNSVLLPPTNPFDQRTPPKKVATVGDLSVKQATKTPLLPSSVSLPSDPVHVCPQAPPTLQPPAPPILHPGWEQSGSVPNIAAGPKSKVTAAYGWNGWQQEPKPEPAQEPVSFTGSGSLSQQLKQILDQNDAVDERGVSPPRHNLTSTLSVPLDPAHAPLIMPLPPEQPVAKTPPLAERPMMVVCPLCPVPGYVLWSDLDHARNMHR